MELEEGDDNAVESNLNKGANSSQYSMNTDSRFSCYNIHNVEYKKWNFTADTESKCDDNIEKEEHEELPVREPYAVRYPGTVVVHVEYTALAS